MSFINSVGVFVFYCMMGYTGLVVLYGIWVAIQGIFVPVSRSAYSVRKPSQSNSNDDFNPVYWDDSSRCNHSNHGCDHHGE